MSENKTDQTKPTKANKETEKRAQRLNSVEIKRKKTIEAVVKNDKTDKSKDNIVEKSIEKVNKNSKNLDKDKNKDKNRLKNLGLIKTFEREKLFPTEIRTNFNRSQKNFMEPDRIKVGQK